MDSDNSITVCKKTTTTSYADIYIDNIVKRKYTIVFLSWALFIVAMFFGLNSFSGLDDGGTYHYYYS